MSSSKTTLQVLDYIYYKQNSSQTGSSAPELQRSTKYSLPSNVQYGPNYPDWRQRISNGQNATTGLDGEEWSWEQNKCNVTARVESTTPPLGFLQTVTTGNLLVADGGLQLDVPSEASANNIALTHFYSRLASQQSKFKGLVFAGELRETLHAIRHPAKALRTGVGSYLKALKRGSRLPKRQRTSFVRRTWLEYAFGWRPLISDIDQAITAFYKSKAARPLFAMVSADGNADVVGFSSIQAVSLGADWTVSYRLRNSTNCNVRYRGVISSVGNGSLNTHSYGFAPWEFVPTIWELIPYSFLVDYFTNIGDIISSWSYRFIGTNWTSKTVRKEASSETTQIQTTHGTSFDPTRHKWTCTGDVGSVKLVHKTVDRQPSAALEIPSLELQCPGFDSRWVNIVALSANLKSARKSLS